MGSPMELLVRVGGEDRTIRVERSPGGWMLHEEGREPVFVEGRALGNGDWLARIGERQVVAGAHVDGDRVDLQVGGQDWRLDIVDARRAALKLGSGADEGAVVTQMPGVVVRALVNVGDRVEAGTPVVVVEAMKMENEFKAPISGVVERILVEAGQRVDAGATLLVMSAEEE